MQQHRFCRACVITELPDPPPSDPWPGAGTGLVPLPAFGTQEPHSEECGTGNSSPLNRIGKFTVKTDANQMAGVRSDNTCICKWSALVHGSYVPAAKPLALVGTFSAVSVATALPWEQTWQCCVLPAFPVVCAYWLRNMQITEFNFICMRPLYNTEYSLFIEIESYKSTYKFNV